MQTQKHICAVHDISCFGRCSLTVVLPILSASGIQTSVIPTAVLSTHTGGFSDYTFRDLSEDIIPIAKHWLSLNLKFDGVYTGYLANKNQVNLIQELFSILSENNPHLMKFVDPVMADDGKFYNSFNNDFPAEIRKICEKADIITPNLTEAALLLGEEPSKFIKSDLTEDEVKNILMRLSDICPRTVIVTGVSLISTGEKTIGAAAFEKKSNSFCFCQTTKIKGFFNGTGDIFSSVTLANLLNGKSIQNSIELATHFVSNAIKNTPQNSDAQFGVNFEANLGFGV